jgi:mannose-1-phosphate guanylyltransferase
MLVQAADHAIGGNEDFRRLLTVAEAHARASGNLVTIGFPPTRVGPGFGHIELGGPLETRDGLTFFRVARFIEKPPIPDAERFTQSGHHLWNSGIFVWTLQDLEQAYRRHMPDLWEALDGLVEVGEPTAERLEPLYSCLKPVAFEHGVLEKSSNLAVVPGIFTWEDIGSWDGLRTVLPGDENGNVIKGQVLTHDVDNSILIAEEGLLGVIGLKDMVVVKSGDCVLVCPRARAQEVRDLLSLHRHAPELLGRR